MVLSGVLRHYASVLMQPAPKKLNAKATREQRALARGVTLRNNYHVLSKEAFDAKRDTLVAGYESGEFLKDGNQEGKPPANPLSDPSQMDGMMGMMKNNMAMMIPNTLIMSWINAFFSGYVTMKLPFPITIKFKSMLQAGVLTKDLDPRWMSSISWYFLCIFGLQFVYVLILGSDNGKFYDKSRVVYVATLLTLLVLQPPARLLSRWPPSRCPSTPWVAPVSTPTSSSRLRPRTWLSSSTTLSWTMWRTVCWRECRCRRLRQHVTR